MRAGPLHNAWALGWASFATDTASAIVTVMLPIFLLQVLGESPTKLGLVVGIGTLVSFGLRWIAGWLADRTRRPKLLAGLGYATSAIAKPLFAMCTSWGAVAGLRVLERFGKAIRSAPRDALIADVPTAEAARAFGLHKALDLGGEAAGTVVLIGAFWLLSAPPAELVRGLLLATAIPGAIAIAIVALAVRETPAAPPGAPESRLGRIGGEAVTLALFSLVIIDQPLLIGRLAELELPVPAIAGIVFAAHAGSIVGALWLGRHLDTRSERRLTVSAMGLNLLALIALAALPLTLASALAVIAALIAQSAILVVARTRVAREGRAARGAAFGTLYLLIGLAAGAAAWGGGAIWTHFGFPTLAAVLAVVNLGFALFVASRR